MRTLCFAIAMALTATGWTQPVAVQLGGISMDGPGIGLKFTLMGDGPEASLPEGWGTLRTGLRVAQGNPLMFVSHYVYDSPGNVFFGYDLLIEKQQSGTYLITFGKLSLSSLELVTDIRRNPPVGWPMPPPSTNPADWTFQPLPSYPAPRTVRERETIRIDLVTDKGTGRKMYDDFQILPARGPARAATARGAFTPSANQTTPTVSGTARDFSAADAELQLVRPRVILNGTPQDTAGRVSPNVRGPLVWFYLPNRGRSILSLVPRPDLDFKKAGEVRGGAVTFTLGEDSIKLECPNPVATGNAPYNLYVLRDPEWEPTAQAQKGQFAIGSVDPGELAALERQ